MKDGPPEIEGIKHNGRWIVVYLRYDIGCALRTWCYRASAMITTLRCGWRGRRCCTRWIGERKHM